MKVCFFFFTNQHDLFLEDQKPELEMFVCVYVCVALRCGEWGRVQKWEGGPRKKHHEGEEVTTRQILSLRAARILVGNYLFFNFWFLSYPCLSTTITKNHHNHQCCRWWWLSDYRHSTTKWRWGIFCKKSMAKVFNITSISLNVSRSSTL